MSWTRNAESNEGHRPGSSGGRTTWALPGGLGRLGSACALFVLAASIVLAPGCSSDSPTGPSTGTLVVEMKDAPTEEISALNVFVVGLTVKPADGPVVRIADEIGPIDLLQLQTRTELLATVNLEPGAYNFVQVDLDQDRSNVVEIATGLEQPLQIASEEIKVLGGFQVSAGDTTRLTLDFDAEQSLRKRGSGSWLLVPVIVQESVEIEG